MKSVESIKMSNMTDFKEMLRKISGCWIHTVKNLLVALNIEVSNCELTLWKSSETLSLRPKRNLRKTVI